MTWHIEARSGVAARRGRTVMCGLDGLVHDPAGSARTEPAITQNIRGGPGDAEGPDQAGEVPAGLGEGAAACRCAGGGCGAGLELGPGLSGDGAVRRRGGAFWWPAW